MSDTRQPKGYLIVHQDWFERPNEADPLLRNARISSMNPEAFAPGTDARLVKHCFEVLEVAESIPVEYTIAECRPVGEPHYETLDEACDFVRDLGVHDPRLGFNPVD